jgi:hypothetical protein
MNGEELDVLVEEGAEGADDSVRRGEEADAAGLEVRRQRLTPNVSEDVVAAAVGNEIYVKGVQYIKERRKAGDAPRASAGIEFREIDSARWVQSDAAKDYENEALRCSTLA